MEHEILQALAQYIESFPDNFSEGNENRIWFIKLIQNSLEGRTCHEIDCDLIYNATTLEHFLARLLEIDIKTIVKVRIIQKIIIAMWEENKWDANILSKYILEEKSTLSNTQYTNMENLNKIEITNQKELLIITFNPPITPLK